MQDLGQCGETITAHQAINTLLKSQFTDGVIWQRSKNKQQSDIFGMLQCSDALLKWFSTGHNPNNTECIKWAATKPYNCAYRLELVKICHLIDTSKIRQTLFGKKIKNNYMTKTT